jgi:hypothetical protein
MKKLSENLINLMIVSIPIGISLSLINMLTIVQPV